MKECSKCGSINNKFPRRGRICQPCINKRQKKYRQENANLWTRDYERTPKGFLMRTYRNMKSRVEGIQKLKAHLYEGKELLSKEQFYKWSLNNPDFERLMTHWILHDYCRIYTPSIDRIDSSKGYTLDNMRWVFFFQNCSEGGKSSSRREGEVIKG